MPLSQEHSAVVPDGTSALHRVWHTAGFSRFIYGVYVVLGVIFYGIAVFTVFGTILRVLNDDSILTPRTILFLCYALLNGILGYGFIWYRKWLLAAFVSILMFLGLWALFFSLSGAAGRAATLLPSVFIATGMLGFLFLTKSFLSGRYMTYKIIVPFVAVLLFSFLLTNFDVLH